MERSTYRQGRGAAADASKNPSFSSSLLDAIYRSIDEGDGVGNNDDTGRPTNRARNQSGEKTDFSATRKRFNTTTTDTKKFTNATTAAVSEKVLLRRRDYSGITEYGRGREAYWQQQQQQRERHVLNSTSSSSESSYGGFSSSEAESVRMKPAKTTSRPPPVMEMRKPKQESSSSNSIKNRFRASKIYGELKKAKTPVSPGGRLASFINQLFTSSGGHLKKVKTSSPAVTATGGDESTCSSASSYSRSCLSKTPSSSRSKASNGGAKRSVRFYPVSVVVGDDLRPCGQKCVYDDYSYVYDRFDLPSRPPLPPVRMKDPALEGRKEWKRRELGLVFGDVDEEEDDDAASYSSSDLFELENLTAVGGDELPVYETTHLHTNRAIAQGLIL